MSVISINPPHVHSPPVSMSRCQAVGVHVSLRRSGDAITIHGSHHGVCSSLQQQAHQFKVTWSLNNSFLKRKKKKGVDFSVSGRRSGVATSVESECWTAVALYLRQPPAAAASLCSSPSRSGESPPRWLWHPAAAAVADRYMMGGRER